MEIHNCQICMINIIFINFNFLGLLNKCFADLYFFPFQSNCGHNGVWVVTCFVMSIIWNEARSCGLNQYSLSMLLKDKAASVPVISKSWLPIIVFWAISQAKTLIKWHAKSDKMVIAMSSQSNKNIVYTTCWEHLITFI